MLARPSLRANKQEQGKVERIVGFRRAGLETGSLAARYPAIAAEWHPTKNGNLTPDRVMGRANRRVWWRCPNGPDHEWQTKIGERTGSRSSSGCPYCARQRLSEVSSLAALFPQVAAQWHPTRNGEFRPDQVLPGSGLKAWWRCPNGPDHEWEAVIGTRTKRNQPAGCPCCAGLKVSVTNSLAAQFPEIAAQWHPTRNGNLTPSLVIAGSKLNVWWRCPEGPDHEWQATLSNRTKPRHATGCPCCTGHQVSVTNSLASLFPKIAADWHPVKNRPLKPEQVLAGSHLKVWWLCPSEPYHEWQTAVKTRTGHGSGCPQCHRARGAVSKKILARSPRIPKGSPSSAATRRRRERPRAESAAAIQRRRAG